MRKTNKAISLMMMILCGLTLTGCTNTQTTVCKVDPEKSNVNTDMSITLTSQDGIVQKVTEEEIIKLKDYNMTKKQFKKVAKELETTYKKYKGLTYTSEITGKQAIQTIEINCDEADEETLILVGLSVDTTNVKKGEKIIISLKDSIKNMEDYGLTCQ